MRIFTEDSGSFYGKYNFVDKNNVLVGFDANQSCCETFGYYISPTERTDINDEETMSEVELAEYNFDTKYFANIAGAEYDEGGMVRFRLTNGQNEAFLHLFNSHNGYYSHGFEFSDNGTKIQSGDL